MFHIHATITQRTDELPGEWSIIQVVDLSIRLLTYWSSGLYLLIINVKFADMKWLTRVISVLSLIVVLSSIAPPTATAQCAMCSLTAQNATENGNQQGKGLNKGIMFLLVIPYLATAGIGILWYTKFRAKKSAKADKPIPLN